MSNVTAKNLILSQPKSGLAGDSKPSPVLPHDVSHNDLSTTVRIEIPGVDPSTVDVHCENNILQVVCERGDFVHSIDPTVDITKIKAEIQWGLLTVTIPSPPTPVTHSIKVSIHDAVKKAPTKSTAEEA